MSWIDVLIPLVVGLLLVMRPQAFTKKNASGEENARRYVTLRKIGYVLVGVAALYGVITLVGR